MHTAICAVALGGAALVHRFHSNLLELSLGFDASAYGTLEAADCSIRISIPHS
jgi:hypothetical protein